MKVLMINGSPRPQGNTALALGELERTFADLGIESETVQVGQQESRRQQHQRQKLHKALPVFLLPGGSQQEQRQPGVGTGADEFF